MRSANSGCKNNHWAFPQLKFKQDVDKSCEVPTVAVKIIAQACLQSEGKKILTNYEKRQPWL